MKKLSCLSQFDYFIKQNSIGQKRLLWKFEEAPKSNEQVNQQPLNPFDQIDFKDSTARTALYEEVKGFAELLKSPSDDAINKHAEILLQQVEAAQNAEKNNAETVDKIATNIADSYSNLLRYVDPDAPKILPQVAEKIKSRIKNKEAKIALVAKKETSDTIEIKKQEEAPKTDKSSVPKVDVKKEPVKLPLKLKNNGLIAKSTTLGKKDSTPTDSLLAELQGMADFRISDEGTTADVLKEGSSTALAKQKAQKTDISSGGGLRLSHQTTVVSPQLRSIQGVGDMEALKQAKESKNVIPKGPEINAVTERDETPAQKAVVDKALSVLAGGNRAFDFNGAKWTIDYRGDNKYIVLLDKNQKPNPPNYVLEDASKHLDYSKTKDVVTFSDRNGLTWIARQENSNIVNIVQKKGEKDSYFSFSYVNEVA